MNLRRALASALLGLAVAAAGPVTAAHAAPADYPPDADVAISLSATVVSVGGSVTVSGSGFRADSTVSVTSSAAGQGFVADRSGAALGALRPVAAGPAAAAVPQRFALVGVATDAAGAFSTRLTFSSAGTYVVTAAGLSASGAPATASATVTVVAAGGGDGGDDGSDSGAGSGSDSGSAGGLPNTGSSIGLPLTVGTVLVLLGAALVTVFRRRRSGDAVA